MQRFFDQYGKIMSFLMICLLIDLTLGNDVLNNFLLLVLISMIMLNSGRFVALIGGKKK